MPIYSYSETVLQPKSVLYDPQRIIRPLQELSLAEKLFPSLEIESLEALKYTYFELGERNLPSIVHDASSDGEADTIVSQQKEVMLPYIEDFMRYTDFQWKRMQKDPANFDENLRELGEKFADARDIVAIGGGNVDPALSGLMTSTRATDAALTNKVSTTFAGWMAMVAELKSDLRVSIKGRYNKAKPWLLMTEDVYVNAETVFSTTDDKFSALMWLEKEFNGQVFVDDLLGESAPNAADGSQNIMIGIRDPSFAQLLHTGIQRKDISRHAAEVRLRFIQHFVPVTYRVGGYHYEDGVTIT